MKAVIYRCLERPTRSGAKVLKEKITARKEYIVDAVNDYIYLRVHEANKIRVEEFIVNVFDHKGRKVKSWCYTSTYR